MSIELKEAALRAYFGAVCTAPIFLAHRDRVDDGFEISAAEGLRHADMASPKRRDEYLCGRAALKQVLADTGRSTDTALLSWPSPYCSLSHSYGHAVAVALRAETGIGIDLQLHKSPPPAMAERLLTGDTLAYWQALPESAQAKALQRFWTANEAVYKACPAPQPAYFRHYRLERPFSADSAASIDGTDYRFMVHTAELADGYLSIALRL